MRESHEVDGGDGSLRLAGRRSPEERPPRLLRRGQALACRHHRPGPAPDAVLAPLLPILTPAA